jgi:hypothetical protein
MKNLYYQNSNKSKYNFRKENHKNISYTPKPKHSGKPIFEPGDIVGFRNYLKGSEGEVKFYRRNKNNGCIEYIVDLKDAFSTAIENVYLGWELFLKPLTRKVLVEKYPGFIRCPEKIQIRTGTTTFTSIFYPLARR